MEQCEPAKTASAAPDQLNISALSASSSTGAFFTASENIPVGNQQPEEYVHPLVKYAPKNYAKVREIDFGKKNS